MLVGSALHLVRLIFGTDPTSEKWMTKSIEYGIVIVIKSPAVAVDSPDGVGIE